MTGAEEKRGGATVGLISELDGLEAASVIYLRLWCNGADSQASVHGDFIATLGVEHGQKALTCFEDLCRICAQHGRRPLMRHSVNCKCLGSDESCFANFIGTAAQGARDDAMLIATLLVRPDMAPLVTSLATDFGLALKRMNLRAPLQVKKADRYNHIQPTTLH
jgi:hypothetical protein